MLIKFLPVLKKKRTEVIQQKHIEYDKREMKIKNVSEKNRDKVVHQNCVKEQHKLANQDGHYICYSRCLVS